MNWQALLQECTFSTSRSGGPGGQHANKVDTQVELRFDLMASMHLSTFQKQLAKDRLSSRLTKDQVLIIKANTERSQIANRKQAEQRFQALLEWATVPPRRRKKPRPPRSFHRKRLEQKKRRSEKKQNRRGNWD